MSIVIAALFATVALASIATLADAVARGRNAFRSLRREAGEVRNPLITVTIEEFADAVIAAPPVMRRGAVISARPARRSPARHPAPLRAAA